MLLTALLQALPQYTLSHDPEQIRELGVEGIVYDSRRAEEGQVFVCMPGIRADGHAYASKAYGAGCRMFVCSRPLDLPTDAVQIRVETPRLALAQLSAAFYGYPAESLTVIGITGTKGKTTTAILLAGLLSDHGIPCAYIGSNGIVIGDSHYETVNTTPESRELHKYFRMMVDSGITHVVMEVSSQALHTYRVHGIRFDTCLYTNLSQDHIGAADGEHATFAEYLSCKRRLFTDHGCRHIVANIDDPHWQAVAAVPGVHTVTYAIDTAVREDTGAPVDFRGSNIHPFRNETALGIDFDCVHAGGRTPTRLRTPGDFSVYNGLCAMAAASLYGAAPESCAASLARMSIRGRFEIVDALDGVTFLIDYAHNGMSLENALSALRRYSPRRLICLFGSVGGRTRERRRELAEVSGRLADLSIITSDNPDSEDPNEIIREILSWFDKTRPYVVIPDREEAIRAAVRMAEPGDIVLLAGKGHENYQLIRGENVPFSEKGILLDEAMQIREKLVL